MLRPPHTLVNCLFGAVNITYKYIKRNKEDVSTYDYVYQAKNY